MTAEVAVLNREAAAIAADSATTLFFQSSEDEKVYNSANKIFELSAVHPVGIMIHGLGSYGPVPWETIVKMYRHQLRDCEFETVAEYGADFVEYLENFEAEFTTDLQRDYALEIINSEITAIRHRMKHLAAEIGAARNSPKRAQLRPYLFDFMESRREHLHETICLAPIDDADATQRISDLYGDWPLFLANAFTEVTVDQDVVDVATSLAIAALKSVPTDGFTTGLVVVGFGTSEIYPSWAHFSVGPPIDGRPRWCTVKTLKIEANRPVDIQTFAQDDMALTFLRGMHPDLQSLLRGIVDQALGGFISQLHQDLGGLTLPAAVSNCISNLESRRKTIISQLELILDDVIATEHYEPVESTVLRLPKEELAVLAETLVGLTSLRRRMTPGLDSVGGPIDVALITKGDGLVWIKRKHYFGKDLNLRYFERNRFDRVAIVNQGEGTNAEE